MSMKKINLLCILLCLTSVGFSQNLQYDYMAYIDSSGMYLDKAGNNITASIVIGAAGVGLGMALDSFLNKGIVDGEERDDSGDYVIFAGAVVSVACLFTYIVQLKLAGKYLRKANQIHLQEQSRLQLSPATSGIGIALNL